MVSEIRVGVVGARRGESFIKGPVEFYGMRLVALCDSWKERLQEVGQKYGVATFTDYDAFLGHDMDAVFRIFGLSLPGHSNWYRLHGTRGAMEITRGPGYFGPEQVRVWHEQWDRWPGQPLDRTYRPEWPAHAELAEKAGHGGGDFWTNYHFAKAIRSGKRPYLDVYRAVAMSSVGILAWKSALQDGVPLDVPDFSDEKQRKKIEKNHWSPSLKNPVAGQPPPSILGLIEPSPDGVRRAREVWSEMGYHGE